MEVPLHKCVPRAKFLKTRFPASSPTIKIEIHSCTGNHVHCHTRRRARIIITPFFTPCNGTKYHFQRIKKFKEISMKKVSTFAMVAVLILTAALSVMQSGRALAANGPAEVSVTVKNMTGGTVTLRMTDGEGVAHWFTFDGQGMFKVSVPEGQYSYYASTPCGGENGEFNLNVSKSLKFYCEDGLGVSLTKPEGSCSVYGWWHWYSGFGTAPEDGHWHFIDTVPFDTGDSSWEQRCTDGDPTFGSEK
jgi:hypothetical protein